MLREGGELPSLSRSWTLKQGLLTRVFRFNSKEASDTFIAGVVTVMNEKLEVKPEPPTCRTPTYTRYDGLRFSADADGKCVSITLLEDSTLSPRDVAVGRKIDSIYQQCYYTS